MTPRIERGQVVRSLAGHDKGQLLCVLDVQEDFAFLTDGHHHKIAHPKRKRAKHIEVVGKLSHPAGEKLLTGVPLGNRELRGALAAMTDKLEV